MSIVRVPALLHCQTVQDWMSTLQKHPTFLGKHQLKNIEISQQNAIIYFALQGMAPFFTCCVLFKGKIFLLSGEEHLLILYRFIIKNEPINHKAWPFPEPFPTNTESGTFSDISKKHRQLILSTKIVTNDCRAETHKEFDALCRFYHKTDSFISSPM